MAEYKSLKEISPDYNFIVFDASILDAASARSYLRKRYKSELEELLNQHNNFVTDKAVARKANLYNKTKISENCIKNIKVYNGLIEFLTPLAKEEGIIEDYIKDPLGSVRLAALAFGLANICKKTAFLSSDRKLNNLIHKVTEKLKDEGYKGFPCSINTLNVYSFVQKRTSFILFEEEKKLRKLIHGGIMSPKFQPVFSQYD